MSKQEVEKTLTIAALKRLVAIAYMVKEPILIETDVFPVGNIEYEYHLYLTENGLERRQVKPAKCLLYPIHLSEVVDYYRLTSTKLDQLYKELNEQAGS